MALYALGALAREVTHRAHAGPLAVVPVVLAVAAIAWPACCLARLLLALADPGRVNRAALAGWQRRAGEHEKAKTFARLDAVPEWSPGPLPRPSAPDVYGGTLDGWQSLLAVHGASLLAGQPLLVADFSGQLASGQLTGLAQRHGIQAAVHLLPAASEPPAGSWPG